ncbi:MAG: PASTA domain-containing protein [Ruminococcus sp.]|nr:PASTA domain-containing protein [Ruminococcus sp.]
MIDRPTVVMKRRIRLWITLVIIAVVIYTVVCIFKVAVTESQKWQDLANSQQLTSTTVSASRGTIYDSTGEVLAQSATIYTVYVDCTMLWEYIDEKDETIEEYEELIADENDAADIAQYQEALDECLTSDETYNQIVEFMAETLELEQEDVIEDFSDKDAQYVTMKEEVEKTTAEKIENFLSEIDVDGIRCSPTTERIYPQGSLAANVIGHTDYDGYGVYGLESYYEDYLAGIDGRIITASDKYGTEIPYKYKQSYDAQDGDSLYLNIDVNIQYYLEKALAECVEENDPAERACGIIMNPNTGEIYAMATNYSYDPNEPNVITDEDTIAMLSALDSDSQEYTDEQLTAWTTQWKNKAISELYYPGSVFKVITGSAALEENAITLEDRFNCGTSIHVEDRDFNCWASTDHGYQNLQEAMTNSCNPVFVQIGQCLGIDKFYEYLEAFGFTEKTGIDLPGESNSIYYTPENMGLVELASESFGQTNKVTPIQMICAYAAVINGGYLVTPQIVDKITDSNGNVVEDYQTEIKRQVISEDVSAQMREILENVVSSNTGGNAYIQGYSIGGKSGTSQKIDVDSTGNTYVSSYCAFAPADDPEVIMLVMVDDPQGDNYYGSKVAAPVCTEVLSDVLPYLGIFPEYTDEELEELEVSVPNVVYQDVTEATETIEALDLEVTVIGDGDTVLRQSPTGASVQRGGSVVLYTDNTTAEETVTVPSVEGLTKDAAKELLQSYGLNMTAEGSAANEDNAYAQANEATGTTVTVGTTITVTFQQTTVSSQ